MVVGFGVLLPAVRHPPPILGPILGADQKIFDFNFDVGTVARVLGKLAHVGHDFVDGRVALG